MAQMEIEKLRRCGEAAWAKKLRWDGLLRECFAYAAPERSLYDAGSGDGTDMKGKQGRKKSGHVTDSTLINDVIKLVNRIQSELVPPQQKWATLVPGPFIDKAQQQNARKQLADIEAKLFGAIRLSNFDQSISEWLFDLVVAGTAFMMVHGDDDDPLMYTAIPQSHIAMREGANGKLDLFCQKHTLRGETIKDQWPDAKLSDMAETEYKDNPEQEVTLLAITYYDKQERIWRYDVLHQDDKAEGANERIVSRTYRLNRIVAARWMKLPGEVQGRSPVMIALADAKTLNKVKELLLRNAALAVSGVWMARNDGVINANSVRIFPGAVLPVRSTAGPNGASLARLDVGGDLQLAQIVIDDLQTAIHSIMMNTALPPDAGPVRSATEIIERLKQIQQDLGAPFGRMLKEGIVPMLEASLFALGERGIVPRLDDGGAIKIDGGNIDVEFSSPLAQAQNLRDIETVLTWLQQLQLLGEEAMMLSAKVEDIGAWLGDKQNVPPELMRAPNERQNLQGMAGQLLARQQQGAVLPEGAPGPGVSPAANVAVQPLAA
jgi:hypothetical protein